MPTQVSICSTAAVLVGGKPIQNMADAQTEAIVATELYPGLRDWLMGSYRWRMCATMVTLARLGAAPLSRFAAAYALPGDALMLNTVRVGNRIVEYDRYDNNIWLDAGVSDAVVLDYTRRVTEDFFPPYFEQTLRYLLAANFAIPLAEDPAKAAFYDTRFIRTFANARNLDSQQQTAKKLPLGGYAAFAVRRGSGGQGTL